MRSAPWLVIRMLLRLAGYTGRLNDSILRSKQTESNVVVLVQEELRAKAPRTQRLAKRRSLLFLASLCVLSAFARGLGTSNLGRHLKAFAVLPRQQLVRFLVVDDAFGLGVNHELPAKLVFDPVELQAVIFGQVLLHA